MSNNILTKIKSQYEVFTKVEKRIADILLEDPQKFITYSTAKVAKLCDVSQGSINNFAGKFTSSGFSFLKLEIARCLTLEQGIAIDTPAKKSGAHINVMERKLRQNISALCNTFEINDEDNLKAAADLILSSKRLEIFAVFRSGIVAKDLHYSLSRLGINANFISDYLMFNVSASTLGTDDLVIAVSSSGTTSEVVSAANTAKSNGVKVICLTSNKFSPLASLADVVLLTTAGHGANDGRVERTRMSQLLVVDSLCGYIEAYEKPANFNSNEISIILNSHSIEK